MKALYGKPGQAGRVRRDPQRPSSRQELRALPGSPALACALIRAWIAAWMVMVIRALMVPTDGADTRRGLPLNDVWVLLRGARGLNKNKIDELDELGYTITCSDQHRPSTLVCQA